MCAGRSELKFSERGAVSKKCFVALQQQKKANSSLRHSLSAAGLCGEPDVALCVPQMFSPPEKGRCCTKVEIRLDFVEHVSAIPRGGFKKTSKFNALKSSAENNSLQLQQWKV